MILNDINAAKIQGELRLKIDEPMRIASIDVWVRH
jgi:hypothetical protein